MEGARVKVENLDIALGVQEASSAVGDQQASGGSGAATLWGIRGSNPLVASG